MNKDECVVCRDKFSLRVRKPIHCPYCQFCCCMSCFKQYMLSSASEPACMECKVQFSYEFMIATLPLTFWHNDYKDFRKNLLLAKEESLLPDTQGCVVRIKRKDAFYQHVKEVRAEIDRMFQHYNRLLARMNQMTDLVHQERRGQVDIPDDHPFFLSGRDEKKTDGGFVELFYMPEGDRSRWIVGGLYNHVTSELPGLDLRSASVTGQYLLARNLRLTAEYTMDLENTAHKMTVGFVAAF